jgi:hypothetical protein
VERGESGQVLCVAELDVAAELSLRGHFTVQERQLSRDVNGFPDLSVWRVLGPARSRLRQ